MQWNGSTLSKTAVQGFGGAVQDVWGFGFGASKPGNTYPTVFVYGTMNSIFSIWQSDDHCVTWKNLNPIDNQFIMSSMDQVRDISGDMNTYGVCYVGFIGSGT